MVACGNEVYECGDCIDNDGDLGIDFFDIECISPCDDDESSFQTGIPGDNVDACKQDCFFDGNSGSGNDGCLWDLSCDPLGPGGDECPYDPAETNCGNEPQPKQCLENCSVPNGCDCFGCCTVTVGGVEYDIFVPAADCSVDDIAACPTCTPQESCENPCDMCELCFGMTELPPECTMPECDGGLQPCLDHPDCPDGFFCQTGCCTIDPV